MDGKTFKASGQKNDQSFPEKFSRGRGRSNSSINKDNKPNDGGYHQSTQSGNQANSMPILFKPKQDYVTSENGCETKLNPRRRYLGKKNHEHNRHGTTHASRIEYNHIESKPSHKSGHIHTDPRKCDFIRSSKNYPAKPLLSDNSRNIDHDTTNLDMACITINFRKANAYESNDENWDKDPETVLTDTIINHSNLNPTALEFTPKTLFLGSEENFIPEISNPTTEKSPETYSQLCELVKKKSEPYLENSFEFSLAKSMTSPQPWDNESQNTYKRKGRYKKLENSIPSDNDFSLDTTLNSSIASSTDACNESVSSNTSGILQSSKYKTTKYAYPSQRRSFPNGNSNHNISEYEMFQKKYRSLSDNKDFNIVEEIEGDLFTMDESYALGNCVASDFNMGSGIAVNFRLQFKGVDELLSQNQSQGGLAFLNVNGRFIYYLVTKQESAKKPSYETLYKSLKKLKQHMVDNKVKLLAIPRLGCGLDRLEWRRVKIMIEYIFQESDIKITVCNYEKADESMTETKERLVNRTCPVLRSECSITTAEAYSIILYLGTTNGHIDKQLTELDSKFRLLQDYTQGSRELGKVITSNVQNYTYYIAGCIVKNQYTDNMDFKSFEKCIKEINKINNNFRKTDEHYTKVSIQTYWDPIDSMLMTKLENLMKNTFANITITIHKCS